MDTQFAPVVNLAVQHQLHAHGVMGDYHLLLAHLVMRDWNSLSDDPVLANDVSDYYKYYRHVQPDAFVIMDNSLIELGVPMGTGALLDACEITKAKALVLPDKLGDMKATIKLSVEAAEEIGWPPGDCKFMAVAQGQALDELKACVQSFIKEIPHLGYISVPRVVTKDLGSRTTAVQMVAEVVEDFGLDISIHLLGFSNNPVDDFVTAQHPRVMGIDSAFPVWFGMQGGVIPSRLPNMGDLCSIRWDDEDATVEFVEVATRAGKRPANFMELKEIPLPELVDVVYNLNCVRKWLE